MVKVAGNVALVSFQVCLLVVFDIGQRRLAVAHSVALEVRFGNDIEAIAVGELVEIGVVGVVRRADGVDVVFLHYLEVLRHAVAANDIAAVGVEFVAVNAFDEYGLTVDKQLGVFDFDLAETDGHGDFFNQLAVFSGGYEQIVEVGGFGAPLLRVFNV